MEEQLGLRERKKQKTRLLIAETARRLFAERGFDAVSVAEVARDAEVSEATVFNYFPAKEDLVYQGMETFEGELLASVRDRPEGVSVLEAFGRFVLEPRGLLAAGDPASIAALLAVSRMIGSSASLAARERQILVRYAEALAGLLAEETGAGPDDVVPKVVATTLIGLHRGLIELVRSRVAKGPVDPKRLAREVRAQGQKALELLRCGLGDYGTSRQP
jgi:AcrR family transcriptional regulator